LQHVFNRLEQCNVELQTFAPLLPSRVQRFVPL
jgi:hypothetical protein